MIDIVEVVKDINITTEAIEPTKESNKVTNEQIISDSNLDILTNVKVLESDVSFVSEKPLTSDSYLSVNSQTVSMNIEKINSSSNSESLKQIWF